MKKIKSLILFIFIILSITINVPLYGALVAEYKFNGNANDVTLGLVDRVGGGRLDDDGRMGQSSATIPHQPLYIG